MTRITRTRLSLYFGGLGLLVTSSPVMAARLDYEPVWKEEILDRQMPSNAAYVPQELGAPLADAELNEMRGKFIRPDAVSYFGISLLTSWEDAAGVTTVARMLFNVDFLGSNSSKILVGWTRDDADSGADVVGSPSGDSGYGVVPIGALETFAGAGQVNVIAGADNETRNSLRVAIVPHGRLPKEDMSGLKPISEMSGNDWDDGDQVRFRAADNSLAVVMTGGNGQDSTMQSLGGELGKILQQNILNTDNNNIFNSASIVFGLDASKSAGSVRLDEAITTLKGHGF